MGTFAELTRRILRWALFGVLTLTALALVTRYVILHDTKTITSAAIPGRHGDTQLIRAKRGNTPVYLVPTSRIPRTQAQRQTAPAITLVAGDWADNTDSGTGPSSDATSVPTADRKLLAYDINHFLQAWETYTPPEGAAVSPGTVESGYSAAVAPWVDPADLQNVINRDDNRQPTQICPAAGCTTGSQYAGGDAWDLMNVRYYNGAQAYVTVTAYVRYRDITSDDGLDGTVWERSYGLLLDKTPNRWLITRAAADTVAQQQP